MFIKRGFVVIACCAVALNQAHGAQFDAKDIPEYSRVSYIASGCKALAEGNMNTWGSMDAQTTRKAWMCAGAVDTVFQMLVISHETCPKSGTMLDLTVKVNHYIENHPTRINEPFILVLTDALKGMSPCQIAEEKK